jgi:cysteine desulfurase
VRTSLRASSVHPVVHVTGNFASESPLSPPVRDALLAAFDQGWADPKKQSQAASRAAILRNQSIENIAFRLGIPVQSVEVLGEPSLGHFFAIAGFLTKESTFAYASIDKGKVRAIARRHEGSNLEIPVRPDGQILFPDSLPSATTLSFQLANGETGITQLHNRAMENAAFISIDATTSGARVALPSRWDSALFDARSWNGPAGLSILSIANRADFAYPLPRIAPISAPGSYSLPLLIAASVALENFTVETADNRDFLISELKKIEKVKIVGEGLPAINSVLSCVVQGVRNEVIVKELGKLGIDIDAGSACSAADLQPSHVLAAMGYETDGHLRFTIRPEATKEEIKRAVQAVKEVISDN